MTQQQADPPATPMTVRDVLLLVLQADASGALTTLQQAISTHVPIRPERRCARSGQHDGPIPCRFSPQSGFPWPKNRVLIR
jgi:hypothetical protein